MAVTRDFETPEPSAQLQYTHAVLMGDIVSSESTPSVLRLHEVFNAAIDAANRDARAKLVSPLTITLGDEFQGLCANLSDGMQVLRVLRARMLLEEVECRFVLGVISLETPINYERAWNMMGPGLAASRERLADKRDANAYRFELPGQRATETLMEAVGAAITDVERNWTARQREIVLASAHATPAELVQRLDLSLPTLYKIRRAGRFELYEREWRALAAAASALDSTYGLT
jgi:hypothetical protein